MTEAVDWRALVQALTADLRRAGASCADADEAAQEAVERLLLALRRGERVDRPAAWLSRTARNAWIDRQRVRGRREVLSNGPPEVADPEAADAPLTPALALWAAAAMASLPDKEREALERVDLRGMSRREAADDLGLTVRGLNSRVQRGRRRLRGLVEACCEVAVDARGAPMDFHRRAQGAPGCC